MVQRSLAYFSKPVQIYNIGKEVVGTLKYPSEKIICKKKSRSQTDLYFLRVKKDTITFISTFPFPHQSMLGHFGKLLKVCVVFNIALGDRVTIDHC